MNRSAAVAQGFDAVDFTELGRFLIALGDPTRQQIVMALSRERLNVNQLTERFPLSRPAMSHHLKVLSHGGLLVQERQGRERVYRVNVSRCRQLVNQLKGFISTCCAGPQCC
ncbi:MAG TPA: metalloregulator ArsR/SmtB family transcription factor [Candidatus Margulisiibacteriota bacterium]|nr:metalloregulator ArsR/SmtB family transcription factor [Candidatus Margulisiibacteriota bacterium]